MPASVSILFHSFGSSSLYCEPAVVRVSVRQCALIAGSFVGNLPSVAYSLWDFFGGRLEKRFIDLSLIHFSWIVSVDRCVSTSSCLLQLPFKT